MTSLQPRAAFVGVAEPLCATSPAAVSRRKRALDVLASASALLLFAPFLALVALAIWVEGAILHCGAPVLFRQQRTGLGGRTFDILKFRTMCVAEPGEQARQATPG